MKLGILHLYCCIRDYETRQQASDKKNGRLFDFTRNKQGPVSSTNPTILKFVKQRKDPLNQYINELMIDKIS